MCPQHVTVSRTGDSGCRALCYNERQQHGDFMTSQISSEQNLAVPEETERRRQLVLRTLPILLIPVFSALLPCCW